MPVPPSRNMLLGNADATSGATPSSTATLDAPTWTHGQGTPITTSKDDPFVPQTWMGVSVPSALHPLTIPQLGLALLWPVLAYAMWPSTTTSIAAVLRMLLSVGLGATAATHVLGCVLMVVQRREQERAFESNLAKQQQRRKEE